MAITTTAPSTPSNGNSNNVEVLAERIANLSRRVDEQVVISKTSVDAALTAISVAKLDQERTVSVAFSAAEKANAKTEESQKESNRAIGVLQNDVVSLKESRSQNVGDRTAKTEDKQQFNLNTGLLVTIGLALIALVFKMFLMK
jgi:hypothetical protein